MGIFIYIVVLLFSVIMHEFAHGYAAYLRGDDTAKHAGRLTFNPVPHIELFGSIILPAALVLIQAPVLFGWAKPVPVNGAKFKNPKVDIPLVSIAGPAANILIAVVSGIGIRIIHMMPSFEQGFGGSISSVLYIMVIVNVVLLVINLIPIPPLDGSKVITLFLPQDIAVKYIRLNPFLCMITLIVLLWSGILWQVLGPVISILTVIVSGVPLR
ncbi:MAG: site-2 protease family protein [Endomicrobia bacterium]|nr:site-2 protease family protein [Endomicrobiia bacterium]